MTDWSPAPPPSQPSTPAGAPARSSQPARASRSSVTFPPIPGSDLLAASRIPWKPWDIPPDISGLGALVGAGGYDFDDWAGRFYSPRGRSRGNTQVSSREWFPFYQLYFSFLEIGHTFHQEPMLRQFMELERRSKAGMRFAVKVHRDISHKGVWDPEEGKSLMRRHAEAVSPLSESGRFYSFLIQLDDGLERNRKVLDYLLATASVAVCEGLDVHVEFRNRTWHQESVLQSLKDAGVGICNTDIPALPDAFPLKAYATSGKGYVRYNGLNLPAWKTWKEWGTAGGDPGMSRRGSPSERLRAGNARYDYLYSQAELQKRVQGQLQLLEKAGSVAVVFKNHVGAGAALNAVQDIHLLTRGLRPGPGTRLA